MTSFSFGQPDGAVFQLAYKVADIECAALEFTRRLGVGPWFVMGPFTPPAARYLGEPCTFEVTLAFGFSGAMQIELLQQHNGAASTLRDSPLGFHHWGRCVSDYDAALTKHLADGDVQVFFDQAPDGGRFAYVDTRAHLPAYVELIEINAERDAMFTMMRQAAANWDGADAIRRMG